MLSVENLQYRVSNKLILHKISFKAVPGTVTAIIGPNGAGKSSLLKQIAQSVPTQQGQIYWKGRPISAISTTNMALQRAVFSQKSNLDGGFNAREIVMMGRYPYFKHAPGFEDHEAVNRAMNQLEINSLAEQKYSLLSGGEQQRVQLARAMAQLDSSVENKLLLLDEPLNNLDIRHQIQILNQTRAFARAGNTVILVLHDIQMALRFSDNLLLLNKGKQVVFGQTSLVLDENILSSVYQMPVSIIQNSGLDYPLIWFDSSINENKNKYVSST